MKITRKSLKMMLVFCNFSKKRIKISLSKNFLLLKCLKSLIYN